MSYWKSIRIEDDGLPLNTKVYDEETGILLQGVEKVEVVQSGNDEIRAIVTFLFPRVHITTDYFTKYRRIYNPEATS